MTTHQPQPPINPMVTSYHIDLTENGKLQMALNASTLTLLDSIGYEISPYKYKQFLN